MKTTNPLRLAAVEHGWGLYDVSGKVAYAVGTLEIEAGVGPPSS